MSALKIPRNEPDPGPDIDPSRTMPASGVEQVSEGGLKATGPAWFVDKQLLSARRHRTFLKICLIAAIAWKSETILKIISDTIVKSFEAAYHVEKKTKAAKSSKF